MSTASLSALAYVGAMERTVSCVSENPRARVIGYWLNYQYDLSAAMAVVSSRISGDGIERC